METGRSCAKRFLYSGAAIDEAYRSIDQALSFAPHLIAYAVKANGNLSVLARLASQGCGADIVSVGEMQRALKAGFP
ncbi:MAG: diaminopimelate decarboxylase, partial [Deltaproteobacteria bacterium]|nr:diaminopimelate decarboxylase [Deltaproteobacteria bacterium]